MATDYKFCKYLMHNVITDNNTRIDKEEYEYEKEPRENETN
jgi:hypothetical protein